jgi:hypothetical protein
MFRSGRRNGIEICEKALTLSAAMLSLEAKEFMNWFSIYAVCGF